MSALTSVAATPIDWSAKFFLILFILLWPIVSFRFSMVREFIKKYHHNLAEEKNCYAKAEYIHKVTNMFTQNCNFESLCVNLLSFVLFHSTVILFSALDNSSVQGANWKKKQTHGDHWVLYFHYFLIFWIWKWERLMTYFLILYGVATAVRFLTLKQKRDLSHHADTFWATFAKTLHICSISKSLDIQMETQTNVFRLF